MEKPGHFKSGSLPDLVVRTVAAADVVVGVWIFNDDARRKCWCWIIRVVKAILENMLPIREKMI